MRLPGVGDLAAVAGALPAVFAQLRQITDATASLPRIQAGIDELGARLDGLADGIAAVASATEPLPSVEVVLGRLDGRMAEIQAAMPHLVTIQGQLEALPVLVSRMTDVLETLPAALERMTEVLERFETSIGHLDEQVTGLHGAVEPLGRIAERVPGRRPRA